MFRHAPLPRSLDGSIAVPMHIVSVRGGVHLDPESGTAYADAVMSYVAGPWAGAPVFDLRQEIAEAWLDGRPIPVELLRPRPTGRDPWETVRVVDVPHRPGERRRLRLRYRLGTPHADLGGARPPVLDMEAGRAHWSLGMADLSVGRHLEMWLPANLPFDQSPVSLSVRVVGRRHRPHVLVTNGVVTRAGAQVWRVDFPRWFSALCPMLVLRPADELVGERIGVRLPSGRSVTVETWSERGRPSDDVAPLVGRLLGAAELRFGPCATDRFVTVLDEAAGGMEYAGATTTSPGALAHEVLHSWFGRGVLPARDADGWWDEAIVTYLTAGRPSPEPFGDEPAQVLCSDDPWQRRTPMAAYSDGSRVLRGIAAMVGPPRLEQALRSFHRNGRHRVASTGDLLHHLVGVTGECRLEAVFARWVYGRAVHRDQVTGPGQGVGQPAIASRRPRWAPRRARG